MLELVGISANLDYRLPWNGIPNGEGANSLYNGYLITPPRIYAEEMASDSGSLTSLFTQRNSSPSGSALVSLLAWTNQIYWPGWSIGLYTWEWHPATGQSVTRTDLGWGAVYVAWVHSITQGFDGSLWMNQLGTTLRGLSPDLQTETGEVYDASHFSRVGINYPVVDRSADVVVMSAESGLPYIRVYTLSTGALVRTINVPGPVKYIAPEENQKVYVLCDYNILCLVDYTNGNIAYTGRLPYVAGAIHNTFTWDMAYKRLWVYHHLPNATNGASQSYMTAYYPNPKPTDITKPTLLLPPRQGRTVSAVSRVVGDVGEPVGSRVARASATGGASVDGLGSVSRGDGYVSVDVACNAVGSASVTTTVTV